MAAPDPKSAPSKTPAHAKGIRTFASDRARILKTRDDTEASEQNQTPELQKSEKVDSLKETSPTTTSSSAKDGTNDTTASAQNEPADIVIKDVRTASSLKDTDSTKPAPDEVDSSPTQSVARSDSDEKAAPAHKPAKNKRVVTETDTSGVSGLETGTIVSDRKRQKHSLFSIVKDAVSELGEDATETLSESKLFKKKESPKVAPGTARREVVEKAVSKTPLRRDDHDIVIQRIRTLGTDTKRLRGAPVSIAKGDEAATKETGRWSSEIDDALGAFKAGVGEKVGGTSKQTIGIKRAGVVPAQTGPAPTITERTAQKLEDYAPAHAQLHGDLTRAEMMGQGATSQVAPTTTKRTQDTEEPIVQPPQPEPEMVAPTVPHEPETAAAEADATKNAGHWWDFFFRIFTRDKSDESTAANTTTPTQTTAETAPADTEPQSPSSRTPAETAPPRVESAPVDGSESLVEESQPKPETEPAPEQQYEPDAPQEPEPTPEPTEGPGADTNPYQRTRTEVPFDVAAALRGTPTASTSSADRVTPIMSTINLRAFGIVAALVLVIGVGAGFMFWSSDTENRLSPATFLSADEAVPVTLTNDRISLLQDLRNAINNNPADLLHTYLVYPGTEEVPEETLATATDFFAVLEPRAPGGFIRSLDSRMMLGGVRAEEMEPFMIIKSNAFDTAFAGMLEWEPYLSADLAPLFGEPVSRTFDPDARTVDRTVSARFTDETIAEQHVRILYNAAGDPALLYAFINRNTILITTTPQAFETLLGAF